MLQPNFTPFPQLATERLLLREITMDDAPEVFFLRSEPAILRFLGKEPAVTLREAEEFIALISNNIRTNEAILWGIVLKENPGKLIGNICYWQLVKENYRAQIGYVLSPVYWKRGIMKEAISKILEYGFNTMKLHSVEARLSSGNEASKAVLEATGFVKEAHFREDIFNNGKFEDTLVYSRLDKSMSS